MSGRLKVKSVLDHSFKVDQRNAKYERLSRTVSFLPEPWPE